MIFEKNTICTVFGKPYIYNELQKRLLKWLQREQKTLQKKPQKHKVKQYDQSITSGFKF